jgi:TetR/AcrR family transcriptional regulator, tetracycline repressor protein
VPDTTATGRSGTRTQTKAAPVRRKTVGRPTTPLVSRRGVVEAALQLIDQGGLAHLSLKRLAAEIDVHESSIYYHYRYKSEILADVLRYVLRGFVVDMNTDAGWKAHLLETGPAYYRALAAHPQLVQVLFDEAPRSFGLDVENHTAEVLAQAGFPAQYILPVREQLEALTIGALQFAQKNLFEDVPDDYPHLQAAVEQAQAISPEERYQLALRAYLDGLEIQLQVWKKQKPKKQKPKSRLATRESSSSPRGRKAS